MTSSMVHSETGPLGICGGDDTDDGCDGFGAKLVTEKMKSNEN